MSCLRSEVARAFGADHALSAADLPTPSSVSTRCPDLIGGVGADVVARAGSDANAQRWIHGAVATAGPLMAARGHCFRGIYTRVF